MFKEKIKNINKAKSVLLKVFSVVGVILIFAMAFHAKYVMKAVPDSAAGSLKQNVGCLNLVGVPYGDNKAANFFAWFGNALVYPAAVIVVLLPFFPFKTGKLLNRFIAIPLAFISFCAMFNLCYALNGNANFDFRNILIACEVGFILSFTIIMRIAYNKDVHDFTGKRILSMLGIFLIAFIACLPVNTLATLFSIKGYLFGRLQTDLRIYDFTEMHRYVLYASIIIPLVIYFTLRNTSLNLRKVMLLAISTGVLITFFGEYGSCYVFPTNSEGVMSVNVNALPIHLCHTALYIVPICIAFNFKKLFYFTYFINVFGAMCAMLMPNTGETTNIFASGITIFWANHIAAFMMPILSVALKIFPRPKFKQMLWSLLFFAIYFILIVFLNAWLSNYVPGGTDYFFINSDFILSKILSDKDAQSVLNVTFTWVWGDLTFTIRPLYQSIFFLGYVVIAFLVWFIYALFFRIADSHYDLHNMLIIARKENISMKEKKKLKEMNVEVNHDEVSIVFDSFSKRYGNSQILSAEDINLKVNGGTIFGFLGPNGAGKSTCIKSAIGIQPITSGHISVCGYDVQTESVATKKLIGYVPDHYALYEKLTGREYINYIADLYGVSKKDRDARITKYVNLFDLNQAFDNRMQTYSHGMKQKMTIIAALVHNPKVWILDEPLTGLDPQSIFQVKQCMIGHAQEGNIVFFSSHIIDVVEKLCTRIAIIKKGHIVYEANMADIEREHPEGLEKFYLSMIHDNGDLEL